jgi:competence protein ComEC
VLYKEVPFLRIVIPLCIGIISGLYLKINPNLLLCALFVSVILLFLTLLSDHSHSGLFFGFLFNTSILFSSYLLYFNEKNRITELKPEKTDIVCELSDFAEEKGNNYRLKADIKCIAAVNDCMAAKGSLLIYIKKDSSISDLLPGDILKINCIPVEITNRGNPFEFNYKFYMENQGIKYTSFINRSNIYYKIAPGKRKIRHTALIIREKIINMYRTRGIRGSNLALVAAMTVGDKTLLEPEQKDSFIKAGVMHIMAVSGLHAVILSMFVFNLLFFMKGRFNILRVITALIILWAFAFITGLTPSVMRATLMFTFIQSGNLLKRPANTMNSVLASAFVLMIIRPSVIFDAGFLLSYSAVIFIIAFYKDLYSKVQLKGWISDKIWQSLVITIVAQAGTLPLTIMLFNRFPVYFMLTNLIIVPLSSLLIIIGSVVPLLYPVEIISRVLAGILDYLTTITEYLTQTAARLPGSSIEGIGMTVTECILLTAIISFLCILLFNKNLKPIIYLLASVLFMTIASSVKNISLRKSSELIVYNIPGETEAGIRIGKSLYIYSSDSIASSEALRHCSSLGLKLESVKILKSETLIKTGGKRILFTGSLNTNLLTEASPDIVILSGSRPLIKNISGLNRISDQLILSSEINPYFRMPGDCSTLFIKPVCNIRKSGAFKMIL